MSVEEAERAKFNPFDVTKVWPQADYPLIPVGRMVLNRNPANYIAEVEQIAYAPSHLIPGVEASPDKMLQVSEHIIIIMRLFVSQMTTILTDHWQHYL